MDRRTASTIPYRCALFCVVMLHPGRSTDWSGVIQFYDDLAGDAVGALDMLVQRADIDPRRIGIFGMSNGGYVAPLSVARSKGRIAFVVVRAGSARRVGDNIDYEVANDLRAHGFDSSALRRGVELRRRVTDFVIDRPVLNAASWDSLRAEVRAVRGEPWFSWTRTISDKTPLLIAVAFF